MSAHEQPETIMIVDDTPANLQLLEGMLQGSNFRVLSFPRGDLALRVADKTPPDLVLLDINMPNMDGYQVCERFKAAERLKEIPIIFISGLNETMDKVKAFRVGGVDYITKPFQFEEVQVRIETHLSIRRQRDALRELNKNLEERVQTQVRQISASQMATIFALAKLSESRDDDTGKHIERVQTYCRMLAEKLAEDSPYRQEITPQFIENIVLASPLHDIGKVAIPDSVLLKPGKHTPEEFEIMKTHTLVGAKTLASALAKYPQNAFIRTGLVIARSHHERWDGTGYPDGARGEEISLYARILAVADVYDATRSNRCYRPSTPHEQTCAMIVAGAGTQFDPAIVAVFEREAEEFRRVSLEMIDGADAS